MRDIVNALDEVRKHIGIGHIDLLVGASIGGFQALDLFFFIRQPDDGIPIGPFSDHLFTSQNFSITIDTSINRKETTARITGLRVFMMAQKNPIVTITMEDGSIMKAELYPDIAPESVNNFISLIKKHFYDGVIFHRVIQNFMIQGGDPESKNAPKGKMLGTGGPDYTIPAEFVYPQLFHKRGALSAARLGDEVNPERESSGSQFYIVWGKTYKMNELKQMEKQMGMQMEQNIFNQLAKEHHDEIMNFRRNRDRQGLMELQDQLVDETKKRCKEEGYPKFTDEQVKTYTEMGGTPFLDNQYTVFGEVEEGLDVVEKIQNCETLRGDRPKEDISMEVSLIEE